MEILEAKYKPTHCMLSLLVGFIKEGYGHVTCKMYVKPYEKKVHVRSAFVTEMRIPKQEHEKLLAELKEDEELKQYALQKTNDYFENRIEKFDLHISSVFVLSADTHYIRKVMRNGPNLSNIFERQEECHDLFMVVEFEELSEKVYLSLKYEKSKGYYMKFKKEDRRIIQNHLVGNWKRTFINELLPLVQEKVHFLLPDA